MNSPLLFQVSAALIAIVVFILVLLANWIGYRLGRPQSLKNADESQAGFGAIEGSLLGLMALMLSFSFGLAASKFDKRRELIVEEANNIGTVILRCDLYPDSTRNLFRQDLEKYVQARINYYDAGDDPGKIQAASAETNKLQNIIWERAARVSPTLENLVRSSQMIPALNSMIDIVTTRDASRIAKVPPIVLWVLLFLTLISGFLTGYGSKGKKRNLIMVVGFAAMTTITLYLILDLDRPRRGILNLDSAEQRIVDLQSMFKEVK